MTELQDRVRIAIEASGATVTEATWFAAMFASPENVKITVADCTSYAALCDQLNAKHDEGRWSSRSDHRIYDALTKDNAVVVVHRCWPHLDCWEGS